MNGYFDQVEDGLREAVRRGAHVPWYLCLRPRPSRPAAVTLFTIPRALDGSGAMASGS